MGHDGALRTSTVALLMLLGVPATAVAQTAPGQSGLSAPPSSGDCAAVANPTAPCADLYGTITWEDDRKVMDPGVWDEEHTRVVIDVRLSRQGESFVDSGSSWTVSGTEHMIDVLGQPDAFGSEGCGLANRVNTITGGGVFLDSDPSLGAYIQANIDPDSGTAAIDTWVAANEHFHHDKTGPAGNGGAQVDCQPGPVDSDELINVVPYCQDPSDLMIYGSLSDDGTSIDMSCSSPTHTDLGAQGTEDETITVSGTLHIVQP